MCLISQYYVYKTSRFCLLCFLCHPYIPHYRIFNLLVRFTSSSVEHSEELAGSYAYTHRYGRTSIKYIYKICIKIYIWEDAFSKRLRVLVECELRFQHHKTAYRSSAYRRLINITSIQERVRSLLELTC